MNISIYKNLLIHNRILKIISIGAIDNYISMILEYYDNVMNYEYDIFMSEWRKTIYNDNCIVNLLYFIHSNDFENTLIILHHIDKDKIYNERVIYTKLILKNYIFSMYFLEKYIDLDDMNNMTQQQNILFTDIFNQFYINDDIITFKKCDILFKQYDDVSEFVYTMIKYRNSQYNKIPKEITKYINSQ